MILDNNFAEEEQPITLTDKEIFTKIWTAPRMVFKFIEAHKYEGNQTILLVIAGIAGALQRASDRSLGDDADLLMVIVTSLVAGVLTAFIFYPFYALLVSWTGKWLKGKADTASVLRVFAFSSIPSIFVLILTVLAILFLGKEFFLSETSLLFESTPHTIIFLGLLIPQVILAIWSLILFVIGLSEVQQFSILKAIINIILPILIIAIPLLIVFNIYIDYDAGIKIDLPDN